MCVSIITDPDLIHNLIFINKYSIIYLYIIVSQKGQFCVLQNTKYWRYFFMFIPESQLPTAQTKILSAICRQHTHLIPFIFNSPPKTDSDTVTILFTGRFKPSPEQILSIYQSLQEDPNIDMTSFITSHDAIAITVWFCK